MFFHNIFGFGAQLKIVHYFTWADERESNCLYCCDRNARAACTQSFTLRQ